VVGSVEDRVALDVVVEHANPPGRGPLVDARDAALSFQRVFMTCARLTDTSSTTF